MFITKDCNQMIVAYLFISYIIVTIGDILKFIIAVIILYLLSKPMDRMWDKWFDYRDKLVNLYF